MCTCWFYGLLVALISGNTGNASQSDPSQLFNRLVKLGIIKEGGEGEGEGTREREGSQERGVLAEQPAMTPAEVINTQIPFAIPNLTFTVATLKK